MVGVEVRDEDRRDIANLMTRLPDAGHEAFPRLRARPSGIDQHRPTRCLQEIGEHVTQRTAGKGRRH
jgi:hypothetical protein